MPDFLEGEELEKFQAPRRALEEIVGLARDAARGTQFDSFAAPLEKSASKPSATDQVGDEAARKAFANFAELVRASALYSPSKALGKQIADVGVMMTAIAKDGPTAGGKAASGGELRKSAPRSADLLADLQIADEALARIEASLPVGKGLSASFVRGAIGGLKRGI